MSDDTEGFYSKAQKKRWTKRELRELHRDLIRGFMEDTGLSLRAAIKHAHNGRRELEGQGVFTIRGSYR